MCNALLWLPLRLHAGGAQTQSQTKYPHTFFFLVVLFGFKFTKTRAAIDQFEDLVHIHFIKDNVLPFKF